MATLADQCALYPCGIGQRSGWSPHTHCGAWFPNLYEINEKPFYVLAKWLWYCRSHRKYVFLRQCILQTCICICCNSKIHRGTSDFYHYWNRCIGINCLQLPTDNAPYLSIYTDTVCGLGSDSLDIHQGRNTADHGSKCIYLKLYFHVGLTGHFQLRLCSQSDASIIQMIASICIVLSLSDYVVSGINNIQWMCDCLKTWR